MSAEKGTDGEPDSAERFLADALASARRRLGDGPPDGSVRQPDTLPPPGAGAFASTAVVADVIARLESRREPHARYRIEGEIDHGGQGAILQVWDEDLHRRLAMKSMLGTGGRPRDTPPADSRAVARFLEEAQVTGQLDHPGIVPVHELGLDDRGQLYFTMKLVQGEDLRAVFDKVKEARDGWTETRALNVLLRICEAMAYAHAKGVIHRDLKPANVMVGRFGEVYVMDWGLARVVGQEDPRDLRVAPAAEIVSVRQERAGDTPESPLQTMDGHVLGTPAYMPPEQALGQRDEIGAHSDVYAVGAMLYQLLVGHAPYLEPRSRLANHALWNRVRQGPPAPLRERAPLASAELVAITEKAMARDWRRRYPDMGALAEDLRAWLEGRVVRAYETGRFAELRKWVARNRALSASVAISLALLVTGTSTASLVLAGKNRALARAQLDGDELVLMGLEQQQWELGPAEPANAARYAEWLSKTDDLAARVARFHRPELERQASALAADVPPGAAPAAAGTDLAERHERLARFVARMEAFAGDGGARARVARLLELAHELRERTLEDEDARARWEVARKSIADPVECPAYQGLQLEPQLGLVPIGVDFVSGLWEFWHVATGNEPRLDESKERIVVAEGDGLVLVLIPGGKSVMGAQGGDPSAPRFDPRARAGIEELREVQLDPFFLSKYELTQDQWLRLAGSNPSMYNYHRYDVERFFGRHAITSTHPVEGIDWHESVSLLSRLSLTLPTDAQWEHAARAGTGTIWWTGDQATTLRGSENLADQTLVQERFPAAELEPWDDGYLVHAPVGSFEANPFGLLDVAGNVKEWCLDWLGQGAPFGFVPGTGERVITDGAERVIRGGAFFERADTARSALRGGFRARTVHDTVGVRPARPITRTGGAGGG